MITHHAYNSEVGVDGVGMPKKGRLSLFAAARSRDATQAEQGPSEVKASLEGHTNLGRPLSFACSYTVNLLTAECRTCEVCRVRNIEER